MKTKVVAISAVEVRAPASGRPPTEGPEATPLHGPSPAARPARAPRVRAPSSPPPPLPRPPPPNDGSAALTISAGAESSSPIGDYCHGDDVEDAIYLDAPEPMMGQPRGCAAQAMRRSVRSATAAASRPCPPARLCAGLVLRRPRPPSATAAWLPHTLGHALLPHTAPTVAAAAAAEAAAEAVAEAAAPLHELVALPHRAASGATIVRSQLPPRGAPRPAHQPLQRCGCRRSWRR